jgi:hypothetical protein
MMFPNEEAARRRTPSRAFATLSLAVALLSSTHLFGCVGPGDDLHVADELPPTPTPPAPVEEVEEVEPGPPVDCFPERSNDNLLPTAWGAGPLGDMGVVCDGENAGELDGRTAGLGYGGGAPVLVDGQMATACLVADLGRRCEMDEHIGVSLSVAPTGEVCGDPGGIPGQEQCAELLACGEMPGVEVSLFAGDTLDDMRFLAHVGNCGEGQALHGLSPIASLAGATDLPNVRYLMVCRPAESCGADDGNIAVDALYLTWRE